MNLRGIFNTSLESRRIESYPSPGSQRRESVGEIVLLLRRRGLRQRLLVGLRQVGGELQPVLIRNLLHALGDILGRGGRRGGVPHRLLDELRLDVEVLELPFELVHVLAHLLEVVVLERLLQGLDDDAHVLVDHVHLVLRLQPGHHAVEAGREPEHVEVDVQ